MRFFASFLPAAGLCLAVCLNAQTVQRVPNGAQLTSGDLNVKVQFYSDGAVRVVKWPAGGTFEKVSLSVIQKDVPDLSIRFAESATAITLSSARISIELRKSDGTIRYLAGGRTVLEEQGRVIFNPAHIEQDKAAFNVQQNFKLTAEEGVYGLGQHQSGYMNYRGRTVKLVQANTQAVTPFLVSTEGYGIF